MGPVPRDPFFATGVVQVLFLAIVFGARGTRSVRERADEALHTELPVRTLAGLGGGIGWHGGQVLLTPPAPPGLARPPAAHGVVRPPRPFGLPTLGRRLHAGPPEGARDTLRLQALSFNGDENELGVSSPQGLPDMRRMFSTFLRAAMKIVPTTWHNLDMNDELHTYLVSKLPVDWAQALNERSLRVLSMDDTSMFMTAELRSATPRGKPKRVGLRVLEITDDGEEVTELSLLDTAQGFKHVAVPLDARALNGNLVMLMEAADGMLADFLRTEPMRPMDPRISFSLLADIVYGLEELRTHGLVHGGLSPHSVLLADGRAVLTDLAKVRGTTGDEDPSTADVEALGLILAETVFGDDSADVVRQTLATSDGTKWSLEREFCIIAPNNCFAHLLAGMLCRADERFTLTGVLRALSSSGACPHVVLPGRREAVELPPSWPSTWQ